MSIVRKNAEIQLEILFRFYNAHLNNQNYTESELVKDLKNKCSFEELTPHLVYLIDENFIKGKNEPTGAGTIPFTSRISSKGINKVQSIIDKTIPEMDKIKPNDPKETDPNKQFTNLKEILESHEQKYEPVKQFAIDKFLEKESDYEIVETKRPPYFQNPPILPTSEEIENEIRKTREAAVRRDSDDSSFTIPPTPPKKVTPPDGWSKKRKIEVGSVLAVVAIVISITVSPIGLNFLFPPSPEIHVTDLNAEDGIIEGTFPIYSYEPRTLIPNGTKNEVFFLIVSNTGNEDAHNFWIDVDSKPDGQWFDFHTSAVVHSGTPKNCQNKSSLCTIELIPKETGSIELQYGVSFDHKLYQEIVDDTPKLFFNYGFDEGDDQEIEIFLKMD